MKKKLPFLDVLVTKKTDIILGYQMYRKPTYMDRYLHCAESHSAQKQSAINSLT